MKDLLRIENLKIDANSKDKEITIVEELSLAIERGKTLGVVGESGCGKSVTALSIVGLLGKKLSISGRIYFEDKELTAMKSTELRRLCGKEIGVVFQEPMTALNPMFKIGQQLSEPLRLHLKLSKREAYKRSIELLEEVGIKDAKSVMNCYPHQFSGGMRQRVLIAIAISCNPKLLIADEPTTALDVITQAQILRLLKGLIQKRNMSLLLISHDLGVIAQMSERVAVMYAGEIVEEDRIENLLESPGHPYTEKLLSAARELSSECDQLPIVKGSVPRPEEFIKGCKFSKRCGDAKAICNELRPSFESWNALNGRVKCWKNHKKYHEVEYE